MRTLLCLLIAIVIGVGPALGGSSPAYRSPRLVDAAGKTVGSVSGVSAYGGLLIVLRRVGTSTVLLGANTQTLEPTGTDSGNLLYETRDCSGTRYLRVPDPRSITRGVVVFDQSHVGQGPFQYYYAADPLQPRAVHSCAGTADAAACTNDGGTPLAGGFCCFPAVPQIGGCSYTDGQVVAVGVAAVAVDSTLTPPFRIK
jgi:hypothetical protein